MPFGASPLAGGRIHPRSPLDEGLAGGHGDPCRRARTWHDGAAPARVVQLPWRVGSHHSYAGVGAGLAQAWEEAAAGAGAVR